MTDLYDANDQRIYGRAPLRLTPKQRLRKQIRKEREIGIDPNYFHAKNSRVVGLATLRRDWTNKSMEWDKSNRYEVS